MFESLSAILLCMLVMLGGRYWVLMRRLGQAEQRYRMLSDRFLKHAQDTDRITQVLAHQFQEPLRRLIVYATKLSNACDGCQHHDLQRSVSVIKSQSERISRLCRDLQRYMRLNQHESASEVIYPDRIFQDVRMSARVLEMLGIEAEIEWRAGSESVFFPENYFAQIINILVDNAVEHAEPEDVLRLTITSEPIEDGWVRFVFEDNGTAVPEAHEDVFKLFERLGVNDEMGTGVGLALVRRMVEQKGGRVHMEMTESSTRVIFTVPKEPPIRQKKRVIYAEFLSTPGRGPL
ncbi:ATP-binding protein [Marinobacterium sp. BA1]|uniref:sensor histidine kinase n=1 Tax=Marinobacterium sp. BA1 TaxID=3138931 RepID=UPI0032E7841E